MITHYLKIAFRNMWKYKTQSLIGIFGLAFGIACFVPALYWYSYETSYDGFYPDARHIYRIYSIEKQSGKVNERVPGILETKLHEYFPATETSACFAISYENYSAEDTPYIRLLSLQTDSTFFRVFPQKFVSGDAQQPLQTERNIVLTETAAIRLFGDVDKAIGQQIRNTVYRNLQYIVSAVVKDPPPNTNLSFDVIIFPEMLTMFYNDMPEEARWTSFDKQMYMKINAYTDVKILAGQLREFTSRLETNPNIELLMLPIDDVRHRLNTNLPFTLGFIRLFVAAGLLLLFSAFFNFLNLYLGLFRQRISELRQRMVVGAKGMQVILQMMFELAYVTVLALALALCLVVIVSPLLSGLLSISVEMPWLIRQFFACGALVTALMCTAAIFPLWRLSRLAMQNMSKKQLTGQPVLRRAAVVLQLSVSIVFIVAALVVMMQLSFVNHKDLGFERSGLIQITRMWQVTDNNKWIALMHELEAMPQIENITSNSFELQHDTHSLYEVEWAGKSINEHPAFESIDADSRFAETFRLNMKHGRWWNEGEVRKAVINEEAALIMGFNDPIGAVIRMDTGWMIVDGTKTRIEYEVVGVVNDFHTLSLRSRIHPLIITSASGLMYYYIRVIPGQEREMIKRITALLADIDIPAADIGLTPLDEIYDRLNHSEQAGLKIFFVLATVCLLISLFGIYAVVAASTQRRRKEIAIRKVFGAEVSDIVRMFFREHTLQIIMAGIVALPLAYYAMHRWLQGYAYRTNIPWWLLAGVILAVMVVVLLTVFGQVLKAATENPVNAIKSE